MRKPENFLSWIDTNNWQCEGERRRGGWDKAGWGVRRKGQKRGKAQSKANVWERWGRCKRSMKAKKSYISWGITVPEWAQQSAICSYLTHDLSLLSSVFLYPAFFPSPENETPLVKWQFSLHNTQITLSFAVKLHFHSLLLVASNSSTGEELQQRVILTT